MIAGHAADVMRDLSSTTFCVPVTDKSSTIAYQLDNDFHWYDKTMKHCGVETTLRYVLKHRGHSKMTSPGQMGRGVL